LSTWLYKKDPATEFIKLRYTPFKDGTTLAPKLADLLSFLEKRLHPLLNTGSSILDPDYINMSVRNTSLRNQISSCQHVFYNKTINMNSIT
jgi:hypothetical protein